MSNRSGTTHTGKGVAPRGGDVKPQRGDGSKTCYYYSL